MANVIRAYGFPVCNLLSVIGIAICSLWFGGWFGNAEKDYVKEFNLNEKDTTKHIQSASVTKVVSNSVVNFTTPIPYTAISLFLGVVGGFGNLRNQYKINKYNELEKKFRDEKNNHGVTQKNYYEAIGYIIQAIFVSTNENFDRNCRITIYRHTNDGHLQRIYRHATQTRYQSGGRLRVPDDEGIVGAAWLNHGIAHVSIEHSFGTNKYSNQLKTELDKHGAKLPVDKTNMPTKNYFAMAIIGDTKAKMAVVVLESTEANTFIPDKLESIIAQENSDIAKYIIHKGKLDEILNPDGDLENG